MTPTLSPCDVLCLLLTLLWPCGLLALDCYQCASVDAHADCYLNTVSCQRDHICYSRTETTPYRGNNDAIRHYTIYSMGCKHFSICRDQEMSMPSSHGQSVSTNICCCSDLCEKSDGFADGYRREQCPTLWANYTQSAAPETQHLGAFITVLSMSLLTSVENC